MNPTDIALSGPLSLAIVVSLAAGAVSFASPCVVPLVPGYLAYLAGLVGAQRPPTPSERGPNPPRAPGGPPEVATKPRRRGRLLAATALFVAGFTVVFAIGLGTIVWLSDLLLINQDLLQRTGGVVTVAMGLVFLGLVPTLQRDTRRIRTPDAGLLGAPLLGATFGLGWTLSRTRRRPRPLRHPVLSGCCCGRVGACPGEHMPRRVRYLPMGPTLGIEGIMWHARRMVQLIVLAAALGGSAHVVGGGAVEATCLMAPILVLISAPTIVTATLISHRSRTSGPAFALVATGQYAMHQLLVAAAPPAPVTGQGVILFAGHAAAASLVAVVLLGSRRVLADLVGLLDAVWPLLWATPCWIFDVRPLLIPATSSPVPRDQWRSARACRGPPAPRLHTR